MTNNNDDLSTLHARLKASTTATAGWMKRAEQAERERDVLRAALKSIAILRKSTERTAGENDHVDFISTLDATIDHARSALAEDSLTAILDLKPHVRLDIV